MPFEADKGDELIHYEFSLSECDWFCIIFLYTFQMIFLLQSPVSLTPHPAYINHLLRLT